MRHTSFQMRLVVGAAVIGCLTGTSARSIFATPGSAQIVANPVLISDIADRIRNIDLAVDGSGAVSTLWLGSSIQYSRSADGSSFITPLEVFPASQRPPRVFVTPSGIVYALSYAGGALSFSRSTDGLTFSTAQTLATSVGRYDATTDDWGRLLVVWDSQPSGSPYRRIEFSVSDDGSTFSPPIQVNSQDAWAPHIASDPSGNVHIQYVRQDASANLYYTRSPDAVNFSPPVPVGIGLGGGINAGLAADATGAAHIVWYVGSGATTDVFYARSANGTSFSAPLNISNQPGAYAPALAIGPNDVVHVTWTYFHYDDPCCSGEIYYSQTSDGVNFSPSVNVSGPQLQEREHYESRIAVDELGNVNVVWHHFNDSDLSGAVFYSRSADGMSFSQPLQVSAPSAFADAIVLTLDAQGTPHIAWAGGADFNSTDPYYSRILIIPPSDIDGDGVPDVVDPCPADPTDMCNPSGSAAEVVDSETGGTVETPDGGLALDIEPGDLPDDVTISVTQTVPSDPQVDLTVGASPGLGQALAVYDFEPEGLQFASPVTLTLVADVTELNANQRGRVTIYLFTDTDMDGVPDSFVELPGTVCDVSENPPGTFIATCTAEVDHFSTYALVAPLDSDSDGIPDQFGDLTDVCPTAPNIVDGFFLPLETLVPASVPDIPLPAKAFRQGNTLPLKFDFRCGDSIVTSAPQPEIVAVALHSTAMEFEVVDLDSGQANDNGTLFRSTGISWVFNLSTRYLTPGTYVITIRVPDGRLFNGAFVLR